MQLRWIVLLLVLPAAALAQANGDSLQTALDAVTRRQRDLTLPLPARPSGYYALSQYRHQATPPDDDDDDIAFLDTGRDFTGYGQPENIGAGYQKTISSGAAPYPAVLSEVPVHPPPNQLENVLLDYVKDAYVKDDDDDEEGNYYQYAMDTDAKRSLFRERENDDNGQDVEYRQLLPGYYDNENKQENILLPSLFRERFHTQPDIDQVVEMDKMRRYATNAVSKQLEADEQEKAESKRNNDEEEEYLALLRNLWEKYKEAKPQLLDFDDLTQNDIQEILSSLRNDRSNIRKRQYGYGSGFDIFNNAGLMSQWGTGSSNFAKRNKQRVEGAGQQGANFLYSLKFVAPEVNREAVETLTDNEGIELPDERDEDILHLASGFARNNPEQFMQIYGRPASVDEIYSPNQETYQTLSLETPDIGSRATSTKHLSPLPRDASEYQQLPPANYMVIPERSSNKRFIYEAKRKRYPVTKRSSNFYASPPMLHHKSFNSEGIKDVNKKKSTPITGVTDPKVAQELNQIFSSSVTHEDSSKDNEKKLDSGNNAKSTTSKETKDSVHETTTSHSVTTASVQENTLNNDTETKANFAHNRSGSGEEGSHKSSVHGSSLHMEKETAEPITMSKIQTPLEIKKKSIDWSDYFGIDRRRKKTVPENVETKDAEGNMIDDNWLLNQYYRTLAMVSNPLKKRVASHSHSYSPDNNDNKRDNGKPQAHNPDIFSRSAQRETVKKNMNIKEDSSIDEMDTKLRNMEDLIVNEAVKYTGSHEGTQDPKEIQDMKDKIMSRLAAAYSLEKMRLALAEFKSSLQAQMMSKYNPANLKSTSSDSNAQEESKMKRVAVKKEKAEDDKHDDTDKKKKRNGNKNDVEEETSGEFLDSPVDVEPMSEGYMGRSVDDYETGCPILDQILQRCRSIGYASEDRNQAFLSLCSLHQICNICGPEVGAPTSSACDLMFITEADSVCEEEIKCQRMSHRILTLLHRGHPLGISGISTDHCSNDSCLAQYFLTSPLPNNQPR
nr:PNPL1 [Locusta migratoria]